MGILSLRVVVPVFGYTDLLPQLHDRLSRALSTQVEDLGFVYVLDGGASAQAWPQVRAVAAVDSRVRGLMLAANAGQQACIAVGLEESRGHWCVVMDGDLQDPPEFVPRLLEEARRNGVEVVMTARRQSGQSPLRHALGALYHGLVLGRVNPPRYACFSLLSPSAVQQLLQQPKLSAFYLRPLLELTLGKALVYYDRVATTATTYSVFKLVRLALSKLWSWYVCFRPRRCEIAERV